MSVASTPTCNSIMSKKEKYVLGRRLKIRPGHIQA